MTEHFKPAAADLHQEPPAVEVAVRAMDSLHEIAHLKRLKALGSVLSPDPLVHEHIAAQLPSRKFEARDRILDAYEAGLVDETKAAGMILLFGADERSGTPGQQARQRLATADARTYLSEGYKQVVPVGEKSKIFEALVTPPTGYIDSGPRLQGALQMIAEAGTQNRHHLDENGLLSRKKTVLPLSEETAHSLLLSETTRMLGLYYPRQTTD